MLRRILAFARISAVVDEAHGTAALGWLYRTRGGTMYYQDNKEIPSERIAPLLTGLTGAGYQHVAAGIPGPPSPRLFRPESAHYRVWGGQYRPGESLRKTTPGSRATATG